MDSTVSQHTLSVSEKVKICLLLIIIITTSLKHELENKLLLNGSVKRFRDIVVKGRVQ